MRTYKVLVAVVILALLLAVLVGCGKKKGPDTGKTGEAGGTTAPGAEGAGGAPGAAPPGAAGPGMAPTGPPMPGGSGGAPGGAGAMGGAPAMGGGGAAQDPAALVEEGMDSKQAGDLEGARSAFEDALAADPANEDAQWGLAWTLAQQGNKAEAIAGLQKVAAATQDAKRKSEAQKAIKRLGK